MKEVLELALDLSHKKLRETITNLVVDMNKPIQDCLENELNLKNES